MPREPVPEVCCALSVAYYFTVHWRQVRQVQSFLQLQTHSLTYGQATVAVALLLPFAYAGCFYRRAGAGID